MESSHRSTRLSRSGYPISIRTVQCWQCLKWRIIPTEEEYEEIRSTLSQDPFICRKRPNTRCEDPTDLEDDGSKTWAYDKPNIPKTPTGFKRNELLRKDRTGVDCYYDAPYGKRLRCSNDVVKFVAENPEFKNHVRVSDFSFAVPEVMEDIDSDNVRDE